MNVMVITNQKPITDTKKKSIERNINLTLKKVIKYQGKRTKKERNREELKKQSENNEQNGDKYILIHDYIKSK